MAGGICVGKVALRQPISNAYSKNVRSALSNRRQPGRGHNRGRDLLKWIGLLASCLHFLHPGTFPASAARAQDAGGPHAPGPREPLCKGQLCNSSKQALANELRLLGTM
eukprot:1150835-Pelagomonas_calceolata.AAC.4